MASRQQHFDAFADFMLGLAAERFPLPTAYGPRELADILGVAVTETPIDRQANPYATSDSAVEIADLDTGDGFVDFFDETLEVLLSEGYLRRTSTSKRSGIKATAKTLASSDARPRTLNR